MIENKRKILLLEDDELFASTIVDFLEDENYDITLAKDGHEALDNCYENRYDMYLFDINVPKLSGLELLKDLRASGEKTPTIFLTSYKDEETINNSYLSGCDDYIRKPFNVAELVHRINAVLRRSIKVATKIYILENIYFDSDTRILYLDEKEIILPLKVVQLLELFIKKDNSIVTNEEIIESLWSSSENHSDGSIRLYVNKLRNIVGKEKIINIKKVGYNIQNLVYKNVF